MAMTVRAQYTELDLNIPCRDVRALVKGLSLKLHQEVEGSRIGDDPYNWFVPYDKWEEAERRVSFGTTALKEYRNYFSSYQPLRYFIGYLNKMLRKIEKQLNERKTQIAFDFIGTDDIEALEKEKAKITELKRLIKCPKRYFEEPHFS